MKIDTVTYLDVYPMVQASKSAFICSLTVVVVPLINGLMGKKISPSTWAACILAVFGVGLLTLQGKWEY